MALTQSTVVTDNIATLNPLPNDVGGLTAPQLQYLFDKFGAEFTAYFNDTHLAQLASIVAGTSGADNIASATIAGLTGNTVFTQISNLLSIAQAAQAGTIVAGTVTDPMLSNAAGQIKDNLNTTNNTVTEHLADYVRQPGYAVDTGTANHLIIALTPAPTSYVDGMGIVVKVKVDGTAATDVNVDSLGVKTIFDSLGNAVINFKANVTYSMKYESTSGNFIVQGKGGGGNATAGDLILGKTATVDTGPIIGTNTNKKWATGSVTFSTDGRTASVTGLTFTPNIIFFKHDSNANSGGLYIGSIPFTELIRTSILTYLLGITPNANGFAIDLQASWGIGLAAQWWAFE